MRRTTRPLAALALAAVVIGFTAGTARAQDDGEPTPWDQGSISLSLVVSTQDSFGDDYFVAGAGAGYFVLPGLELGGSAVRWFGGEPGITQVSPHVRYVAVPLGWPLLPYVGAFYTHFFVEDAPPDEDTVGARLGLLWHQGSGLVFGVGAAFERFVSDCSDDCSTVYPELTVGFTF